MKIVWMTWRTKGGVSSVTPLKQSSVVNLWIERNFAYLRKFPHLIFYDSHLETLQFDGRLGGA